MGIVVKIVKTEPFHIQAYTLIRDEIMHNKLPFGERVSENMLAQQLNISRSPIREALRMLERDKLVIATPAGYIVNPMPPDEIREVYECRMMLESFAAGLTAAHITDFDVGFLAACIDRSERAHQREDAESVVMANTQFHERIVSLCGNRNLCELHHLNNGLATMARFREFGNYKRDATYIKEHKSILKALESRDADAVEREMREHIAHDLAFYMQNYRESLRAAGGKDNV